MAKIQPAVKSMRFTLDPAIGQYQYISISECASIVNRRFYRAGLNWAVAGLTVIGSGTGSGYITVNRLPERKRKTHDDGSEFRVSNLFLEQN